MPCISWALNKDHCRAIEDLARNGIDVYGSSETIKFFAHHRIHDIDAGKQFKVGSYDILPFETVHDCPGSLGFLIANGSSKLLFATDTAYIKPQFRGLSHLMIECNFLQELLDINVDKGLIDQALKLRVMQSHMSLETLKEFLRKTDLSHVIEIRLMHLSNANSDEARIKREVQELTGKVVIVC